MSAPLRVQHVSVPMPAGGNDEARRFYGETLGFREITPPSVLGSERFVWFQVGDEGHEVHVYTVDPFEKSNPRQHFCVQVDDPDGMRKKLEDAGYPTMDVPVIPNRPRFNTADPFGNHVEISAIIGDYT